MLTKFFLWKTGPFSGFFSYCKLKIIRNKRLDFCVLVLYIHLFDPKPKCQEEFCLLDQFFLACNERNIQRKSCAKRHSERHVLLFVAMSIRYVMVVLSV